METLPMREYGDRGPVGPRTAHSRNQVVIPNPFLSELAICDGYSVYRL
jgi:hypothetical protein